MTTPIFPVPGADLAAAMRAAFAQGRHRENAVILSERPLDAWFSVPLDELGRMIAAVVDEGEQRDPVLVLLLRAFSPEPVEDFVARDPLLRSALQSDGALRQWCAIARSGQARLRGDMDGAWEALASLPAALEPVPGLVDQTRGLRLFCLAQLAMTAALAGRFEESLRLYDKLLLVPGRSGLEFFTREARLRSALLHALYGDPAVARIHRERAAEVPRSGSWAEEHLDAEDELVAALLLAEDDPAGACDAVLGLTYRRMGELWPFFVAALQRVTVAGGRREEGVERMRALRAAGLGAPVRSGFAGSVFGQAFAFDALLTGDVPRARAELANAATEHMGTLLIASALDVREATPHRAVRLARAASAQTHALRQAEAQRLSVLAMAHFVAGDEDAALKTLGRVRPRLVPGVLELLRRLAPALVAIAEHRVPDWPPTCDEAPGAAADLANRPRLTPSEIKVLIGLHRGQSRREIAESLFLSVNTIKTHQRSLFRKLDVSSSAAAVLEGARFGYL